MPGLACEGMGREDPLTLMLKILTRLPMVSLTLNPSPKRGEGLAAARFPSPTPHSREAGRTGRRG